MVDFLRDWAPVWAAAVAGFLLIVQNWLNNKRDDQRRRDDAAEREKDRTFQTAQANAERKHQADLAEAERAAREVERREEREHAVALAEQARKEARSETWRDERRTVHAVLISKLEESEKHLMKVWMEIELGDDGFAVRHEEGLSALSIDFEEELTAAWADVQIIGSEVARNLATAARDAHTDCDVSMWVATHPEYESSRNLNYEGLRRKFENAERSTKAYIDAVRVDLGTAD